MSADATGGVAHLLAAAYRQLADDAAHPKAFATFMELTQLAGCSASPNASTCWRVTALCIDEFELDDPGDTTLISRLLSQLVERRVSVAATSNTLPEQLSEGRVAPGLSARNQHPGGNFRRRPY